MRCCPAPSTRRCCGRTRTSSLAWRPSTPWMSASRTMSPRQSRISHQTMPRLCRAPWSASTAAVSIVCNLPLSEPEPHADDDRERQPGAVVVDVVEPGAHELIHLRKPTDVPQPKLRVEVHPVGNREQHAGADAPGERSRSIVEVRVVRDDLRLRRRELYVDPIDVGDADGGLRIHAKALGLYGYRHVSPVTKVEAERLVVRVLRVERRWPHVAEPHQ